MREKISPSLEDYLRNVLLIQEKNKVVRVKDLASAMQVKAPSVNEALKNLKKKGYVLHEPYKGVSLTQDGIALARKINQRHDMLCRFLENILGVDPQLAYQEACKIEHYMSRSILKRICQFSNFFDAMDPHQRSWLESFSEFVQSAEEKDGCCVLSCSKRESNFVNCPLR